MVPTWNVDRAFERGTARNFLINTWGGLGDQVCAEPAIRFALKTFTKCAISLASRQPDLFTHLKFKEVFDTRKVIPVHDNYLVFQTIKPPTDLLWEFYSHMLAHCVDFPSVCMFRLQLPNADKEIQLPDYPVTNELVAEAISADASDLRGKGAIVVHPGRHWASKTFPVAWWNAVLDELKRAGFTPVLIGQTVDQNTGYVNVNPEGCIDTRDKLSIRDLISLLKRCKYVLSNDSAAIHIAAAGDAHIAFIASCKHPDYITHWRKGVFGWNTKNLGRDGIWNHIDFNPSQETAVEVEQLPPGLTMDMILPSPVDVADHFKTLRG